MTQPWRGLGGLAFAAAAFFILAFSAGGAATSLLVLGPIATFALPAVAVVALWWKDWPGTRLRTPWTGVVNTVLVVVAGVALAIAGQAIAERPDLRAVFLAAPGPGVPTTFPATMALAGAVFTAMLQLYFVCERYPLDRLGRVRAGVAALLVSWAVGAGAYFLFVNVSDVPAAVRAADGLHDPGGPVALRDFGAALIVVGMWQAVLFIALRGWPVTLITTRWVRLAAGNVLVAGLGAATYMVLHDLAGLAPDVITPICGCVISAALIVELLFEGWPATLLSPGPRRLVTLGLTAALAIALDLGLTAYANGVHWTRATADDWVTTASLSFAGAGIILHVGIGLRWPFTRTEPTVPDPT